MAVKRWLAMLLVLPGIIGAVLVGSSGTASALPQCNNNTVHYVSEPWPIYYSRYYQPTTELGSDDTNCVLATGSSGGGVFTLQDSLIRCYNQDITFDGLYGPQTRQAVINVQNFHHLTPDGVFGPLTNNAMVWPRYVADTGNFWYCWPR